MDNDTNKIIFFVKKKFNFWFFFVPLLVITLINSGLLIATGWYFIDYKIAEEFAKGLTNEFGKYWSLFYDQLGNTELIMIIIIYLTILLETWFLTKISQKNNKYQTNYWIVNTFYFIIAIVWITGNIIDIILLANKDTGFGKGIDFVLLDDIKYKLITRIIAFFYQSILLTLGLYYIRYHLVKQNRILKEQFWLQAVKVLSFLIITYIVIIILKRITTRTYYYNAIFGDLIKEHPHLLQHYLNSGYQYGYDNGKGFISNIPWDLQYPWWKSNLFLLQSNPAMPRFYLPWEYAFPSGHINACYGIGSIILLFLKNKNNDRVNWKIKVGFIIWLIHILSMNFALVVERLHWMSDIAFTFIFSTLMIIVVHFSVNKIFAKKIK
ncbi:MAG: phosphatase PAP2 family protein [Spiroplasma sp.]